MIVTILEVKSGQHINAKISKVLVDWKKLPSITDGWRFNFRKHAANRKYETFVLAIDKKSNSIEGCLILDSSSPYEVYMAYIEIATHNQGEDKRYDKVAGCLIAYACRLSFLKGKGGYLAFDVMEEKKENERKLMELYSIKNKAVRFSNSTTMLILPEGSEMLINEYLK